MSPSSVMPWELFVCADHACAGSSSSSSTSPGCMAGRAGGVGFDMMGLLQTRQAVVKRLSALVDHDFWASNGSAN